MNIAVRETSGSAPDGRSARWEAHRAERRTALIRMARRAVHTLGYGASMEEIAAASGTSKSVFYRYFGDKSGLQQAMGEVVIAQMQEKILAAGRTASSPRAGMRAMVSAYLQMAQTSPNVYAFVTGRVISDTPGTSSGAALESTLSNFFDSITAMMDRAMRSFLTGRTVSQQQDLAAAFWPTAALGMVRAAGERWLSAGPSRPSEEEMTDQITAWLFDGIEHNLVPDPLAEPDRSPVPANPKEPK